jgi:hypothetical protein
VAQVLQQEVLVQVQGQVQELQDQELPLVVEQEPQALEPQQVQALLAQAQEQLLWLEARVQALAGLLGQVQVEVLELARAVGLPQEQVARAVEQVVEVLPLGQVAPQAVGLEQALGQELVEAEDLQALPLLSLYQLK